MVSVVFIIGNIAVLILCILCSSGDKLALAFFVPFAGVAAYVAWLQIFLFFCLELVAGCLCLVVSLTPTFVVAS